MSIPLALTTITVTRPDPTVDGYAASKPAPTTVASGVRAAITNDTGNTVLTGGVRTQYTFVLNADPCDVQAADLVTDNQTGATYIVEWAQLRTGFGCDHVNGRLRITTGAF